MKASNTNYWQTFFFCILFNIFISLFFYNWCSLANLKNSFHWLVSPIKRNPLSIHFWLSVEFMELVLSYPLFMLSMILLANGIYVTAMAIMIELTFDKTLPPHTHILLIDQPNKFLLFLILFANRSISFPTFYLVIVFFFLWWISDTRIATFFLTLETPHFLPNDWLVLLINNHQWKYWILQVISLDDFQNITFLSVPLNLFAYDFPCWQIKRNSNKSSQLVFRLTVHINNFPLYHFFFVFH